MSRLYVLAVAASCLLAATPAFAIDEIYSPIAEPGELSLEYNGNNTFDHHHDKNNVAEQETELEWGVNNFWVTSLTGDYEKAPDESWKMSAVEWENRFQFLPQGEYWLDVGGLVSYQHAVQNDEPDDLELKLLLQKDSGMFTHILNVGIEQDIGTHANPAPDRSFAWSTRYRMNQYVQPGFEIQSDLGTAGANDRWQNQQHYIGPALYGEIIPNLKYALAVYSGISQAAAQYAGRLQLEYEMHF
jgi:hypothetical protein